MVEPSSEVRESTTRESGFRQNGQCTGIPFECVAPSVRRRGVVNASVT